MPAPLTSDERDYLERQLYQAEQLAADLRAVLDDGWPDPADLPSAVDVDRGYVAGGPVAHLVGSIRDPDLDAWTRGSFGSVVATRTDSPLVRTIRGWHRIVNRHDAEESRPDGDSSSPA